MPLKQYATQYLFNRYFSWRLEQLVAPKFLMTIDFPPNPQPRWGYGKPVHSQLEAIIARGRLVTRRACAVCWRSDLWSKLSRLTP